MGGGTDVGLTASLSLSNTSGNAGDTHNNLNGSNVAGGLNLPKWAIPVAIVSALVAALVFLVRR